MSASNSRPKSGLEPAGDVRWDLVRRIAASPQMKTSPRLSDFLFYVTDCAIRNAPEEATEQQIGVNIFGRPPGYNSSEDSIVRSHARLLRQKLTAYFESEGSAEEVVVEIPKGHYLPVFRPRLPAQQEIDHSLAAGAATLPGHSIAEATPAPLHRGRWVVVGIALPLFLLIGAVVWHPWTKPAQAQSPVEAFWRPFLTGSPSLVIYSNALFVGNSTDGLRYARPGTVAPPDGKGYVDTYTGVGELASVHTLTQLFDQYHSSFVLKRSLLVTWDEAQLRNLIFIGSPAENPSLRVLPPTTDFTMIAGPGFSGIVNHHPLSGEPALFSRPESPLTHDYAILALLPGVTPGHRTLIFSGLTTFGTQAALDYVCQPAGASTLLKKVRDANGQVRPFEAVLETDIGGGVPLRTRLITIRTH
jgi:hypothetical protein